MKASTVPVAVLRLQYQLVRFPLQVVQTRLMTRFDEEAPARLFYERALGGLDVAVGTVLRDEDLQRRGTALGERSEALARAATLDAQATQQHEQADATLKAQREQAVEDQKQARATHQDEVQDARSNAEQRKRAATEDAQKRVATAKEHADDVATQRKSTAEAVKRREETTIRAAEKKATAAADAKLEDSQDKRAEAAGKRANADRVEQLADVEKNKRQSDR